MSVLPKINASTVGQRFSLTNRRDRTLFCPYTQFIGSFTHQAQFNINPEFVNK
jgi:hypothetical protein